MNFFQKLNQLFNNWISAPIANAAGRMGLFRIIYALFYLWCLSPNFSYLLSGYTGPKRYILLTRIFSESLSPFFFESLECLLVAALIILMIGFRVRLTTAIVLCVGCVLESFWASFDSESAVLFIVFYIPLFMLLGGGWGDTYSLDAILKKRQGFKCVEPTNTDGYYFVPARCLLVVLSALFFVGAISKIMGGGTWLNYPKYMAYFVLKQNITASMIGLPLNHLAPFIHENPFIYNFLRISVLLFEGLFFLALFHRKLLKFMIALALVFHSTGAIWLIVTFTPILIIYLVFIDWYAILQRLRIESIHLFDTIPAHLLIAVTLVLAFLAGVFWNTGYSLRPVLNLGGIINWHTIWYPILPIALACLLVAIYDLIWRTLVEKSR